MYGSTYIHKTINTYSYKVFYVKLNENAFPQCKRLLKGKMTMKTFTKANENVFKT